MEVQGFKYWFKIDTQNKYNIYHDDELIGYVDMLNDHVRYDSEEDLYDAIKRDFEKFKKRDEFSVGRKIMLDGVPVEVAKQEYESLIRGILKIRAYDAGKDPDSQEDYIQKVINWVESTTFYEDPASTIYHEAWPSGLLYHTLRVYNKMCELADIPTFSSIDRASASLVCLCHDWCKIGLYEKYKRNVKNESTGVWEKVDSYKRGNFPHPLGHGVASAYMAMKMFRLTEEEFAAIRWHMSMFNVSSNEINEYQQACEDYPLVHLVQFADQLSIVNY